MKIPKMTSEQEARQFLLDNPYYCAKPFYSKTYEADNQISWCCHYTERFKTEEEFEQADRSQFLGNKPVKGCEFCYDVEKTGPYSERITESEHALYRNPQWLESQTPSHMYIRFSNLCNSACRMCVGTNSTLWSKVTETSDQYPFLEISDSNWEQTKRDLQNPSLEEIHLFGGEPLLSPRFPELLDIIDEKVNVMVNTNCTVYKKEWFDRLEKQSNVDFMMSIDAYGSLNEYLRWPCKWDSIKKNVDNFFKHKFNFIAVPVINIYNILQIDELFDFYEEYLKAGVINEHNFYLRPNFCWEPTWMSPKTLPQEILDNAKTRLLELEKRHNLPSNTAWLDTLIQMKSDHEENPDLWKEFQANTARWDLIQNMQCKDHATELFTLLKGKI